MCDYHDGIHFYICVSRQEVRIEKALNTPSYIKGQGPNNFPSFEQ